MAGLDYRVQPHDRRTPGALDIDYWFYYLEFRLGRWSVRAVAANARGHTWIDYRVCYLF